MNRKLRKETMAPGNIMQSDQDVGKLSEEKSDPKGSACHSRG